MRHIVILLLVSMVIFEARAEAVVFIIVAAVAGALVSQRLPGRAPAPLRPLRMFAFLPYFAVHSARGGLDVATRALRVSPALEPAFVEYEMNIRHPVTRVIFANAVSLMPGTLTARIRGGRLTVHTLDAGADVAGRLSALERRVRDAFGEDAP